MRILVTGANGQVGWELQRTLQTLGDVIACDRVTLDLANPDSIRERVRAIKPEVIVNAAAYTAVDKAESEPELAMAVNGVAPGILAEEAKRLGALLIHYSTDYVFDGTKSDAYLEDDRTNPLSEYGKSKLAGEKAIEASGEAYLIFRTSWVYASRGKNFLLTMLRLANEREELRVVDDQFGAPTWCRTVAEGTAHVVAKLCAARPGRARSGVWPTRHLPLYCERARFLVRLCEGDRRRHAKPAPWSRTEADADYHRRVPAARSPPRQLRVV